MLYFKNNKQQTTLKIKTMETINNKAINNTPSVLSDVELLALTIGGKNAVIKSRQLFSQYNYADLRRLTYYDYMQQGLTRSQALRAANLNELIKRTTLSNRPKQITIEDVGGAVKIISPYLQGIPHEEFYAVYLRRNNTVINVTKISQGGTAGTVIDPKIIYKHAINLLAAGIILAHNHPSGNLRPSNADLAITRRLITAGETLDIKILDHLIITDSGYYSMASEGDM